THETVVLEKDRTELYPGEHFLTINNNILYCKARRIARSDEGGYYITKMIELPETEETFDINRIIERDQHCVFGVKGVSADMPLTITEISDKYAGDKFTKIAETGEKYVYSYYQNSNDGKIHLSISRKMDYGNGIDPDIDYMLKTNKKKADAYNIISRYYMGEVVVYAVFAYLSGQDPLNEGLKEEYKYCANMICRGLGLKEMYKMKELDTKDQRDYDVEVCDKKRPILTRTMMERALRGCPVKGLELKNERDE
ncbi:MAG: hypothetical protein LUE65_03375, partial [Clostridiales bacterium]|nr:hypothetical protein [Clostridiales bacterium]